MQKTNRSLGATVQGKLLWTHLIVTLLAVLASEGVVWLAQALLGVTLFWGLHLLLLVGGALFFALVLGIGVSRIGALRVRRMLDICQAWLRGDLSLRIDDSSRDELGFLAGQLNLLAEHLAQDEQDLAELYERNTRLTDQVRALAVVEERNRLARELHDSVKQYLFSLTMTTSGLRARFETILSRLTGESNKELNEIAGVVREVETMAQTAQQEMTRLIKDLRPGSLEEQGLAAALNDYTLLFGAREHVLIYFDVQGNDAILPPLVSEALYRVAQEALHNVARHARATRVDVRLRCLPEQVMLTLRDNGVGFDLDHIHSGLGLANMQERVMEVGGRLVLDSQVGVGTTVCAEVGLTRSAGVSSEIASLDKERPRPSIENWAWLGQRLVIPVGQTWPWLPADQTHLRKPLVEAAGATLTVRKESIFLGMGHQYILQGEAQPAPLVQLRCSRNGYVWHSEGVRWVLQRIHCQNGKMVLTRNGQPLAAVQYQGRLLNTWTEIVYDGRGYRLSCDRDAAGRCVLLDQVGEQLLLIRGGPCLHIELRRALPLPLLAITIARNLDEMRSRGKAVERSS